jgi:hypothetical protein
VELTEEEKEIVHKALITYMGEMIATKAHEGNSVFRARIEERIKITLRLFNRFKTTET